MSVEVVGRSQTEDDLAIRKINELEFEGLKPLGKPSPNSRGVYGGNLCAQAIVVALETVDTGFVPHSLHSYFVAAGDDSKVCQYKVEKVSSGRNFANRLVRLYQDEKLKYIVMISLTKKNSIDKAKDTFDSTGKGPRPFEYQLPPDSKFYKYKVDDLPYYDHSKSKLIEHKLTPEFINKEEEARHELMKSPGERNLSFYIRLNDRKLSTNFKYGSMGILTDSLYLTSISRILHLPSEEGRPLGASGGFTSHFFSISLDHSIYFHDDDFDPTKWLYFRYHSPRFSNNRVLFNGSYYNDQGKLVASIVQEGLVFFKDDAELKAKL